jgi:hypothetical protein
MNLAARRHYNQTRNPTESRGLPSEDQKTFGHDLLWVCTRLKSFQMCWYYLQDIDALTREVFEQSRWVLNPFLRDDMQATSRHQCRENHGVTEVGSNCRDGRKTQTLAYLKSIHDT